jgi:hypothetical protein
MGGKQSPNTRFSTVALVVVLVFILAALFFAGRPHSYVARDKAKEAEVKQNLHNIQIAVERYGVDHGGSYP